MRARTSHTYDAKVASQVASAIPTFLEEAEHFYAELQRRLHDRPVHITLTADHRRLVLNILRANLPKSTKVWVFGSRATGRARRYSDLDLAIDAGRPVRLDEIAELAEAFGDSDLRCKVDLTDWRNVDVRWRQTILAERVALTEATSS